MAEFNFYGTQPDSEGWLRMLAGTQRFSYVHDRYRGHELPQLKKLDNAIGIPLEKQILIYLFSEAFSLFPPSFDPPNPDGLTWVDVSGSGPAMELSLPVGHKDSGRFRVGNGDLRYLPTYRHPITGEWYAPTPALKKAYRQVVSLLKKSMVCRYFPGELVRNGVFVPIVETLWLGLEAATMLDNDQAEILVLGDWVAGGTLYRSKDKATSAMT